MSMIAIHCSDWHGSIVSRHATTPGCPKHANNRFESARAARPTRKSEALLLAAQAGR